jgi:hypothetical protein
MPFRVRQPVDTFIPRYLSVYASTKYFESAADPYNLAATRDTEPLAKSYSDGSLTRLYSIHFQYARACDCSLTTLPSSGGLTRRQVGCDECLDLDPDSELYQTVTSKSTMAFQVGLRILTLRLL